MELLGLDVGATRVIGVVVDNDGTVLRHARREGALRDTLDAVRAELRRPPTFAAAGLATDVELDEQGSDVAAALHDFHRLSLGAAAISAEAWVGAARNAQHAVCLWIGDRVLAGTLLNGRPWMGAHGLAGDAAWLAINPAERQDYRKYGSLSAEVSNRGIARRLAWRIQAGDDSDVLARAGALEAITAAHVFDGARAGDGVAISVVRDSARYVAMAVVNIATVLDPEVIVLGGPMTSAGDLLLEPVRQECQHWLPPAMASCLRIEMSPLGEHGIAIGAAFLALAARQS
jgi:predicted NBD/HSP70 family sugar kinase